MLSQEGNESTKAAKDAHVHPASPRQGQPLGLALNQLGRLRFPSAAPRRPSAALVVPDKGHVITRDQAAAALQVCLRLLIQACLPAAANAGDRGTVCALYDAYHASWSAHHADL
jgi:hypothetical protein